MTFPRKSLVLAVAAFVASSLVVVAAGGVTKTIPACYDTQIKVTVGPTSSAGAKYPVGTRVVPVYFTNEAKTCHLAIGGPEVIAFRHVSRTLESRRVAASPERYSVLVHKQIQKALFAITPLSSAERASSSCGAATATGFLVEDFATPATSWIYFARKISDVCFYAGPKSVISNIKMSLVNPIA